MTTGTQPDQITTPPPGEGGDFTPHPPGVYMARCVDVITLGNRVERTWGKVSPKISLIFRTPAKRDDGQPFDIGRELTLSMADKANLRKFLESWRGRAYTMAQLAAGVPRPNLVGQPAMLSIVHGQSKSHPDRSYARIDSIMPPMKGMPVPELDGYERASYWADRKTEYANELRAYRAESSSAAPAAQVKPVQGTGPGAWQAPPPEDDGDMGDDSDDSIPF